jgi:hypothetical protein
MSEPPERLRRMNPDVDKLWDRKLPTSVNIGRITRGEVDTEHLDNDDPDDLTYFKAERDNIVRALRRPPPQDLQSPLPTLNEHIAIFYRHGRRTASWLYVSLFVAAHGNSTTVQTPPHDNTIEMVRDPSNIAATLVGLFACPSQRLHEVVEFQTEHLNELAFIEAARKTPSASLKAAFSHAKSLACGRNPVMSVIMGSLVDVHMLNLKQQQRPEMLNLNQQRRTENYTSFTHNFVLGIGPEGAIVWQSSAKDERKRGKKPDEPISSAQIQTWQATDEFVDDFEKFVAHKVSFSVHPYNSKRGEC